MKKYNLLFLLLLPVSSVIYGMPRARMSKSMPSWQRDAMIAIELSLGLPMGKIAEERFKNIEVGNSEKVNIKINKNVNLGLMAGYNFSTSQTSAVGLETGLLYGFPRGIEVPEFNLSFKEHHLYLPLVIKISKQYNLPFYLTSSALLGYEFDIPFAARLKQSGDYQGLKPAFQGDKKLSECLPEMPKSLGNILLGTRLNFPAGIYAQVLLKVNLDIFNLDLDTKEKSKDPLDKNFVQAVRTLSADLLTAHIVFNLMDWCYPKEKLEDKYSYKRKLK